MPLIILQSAICFRFLIWGLQGTCFAQNETLKSPLLAQLLSRERPSWHGAGARHCRHLGHTGWPWQGRTARGHLGWQYRLSLCCKLDFKALGTWLPPQKPLGGAWLVRGVQEPRAPWPRAGCHRAAPLSASAAVRGWQGLPVRAATAKPLPGTASCGQGRRWRLLNDSSVAA